MNNFNLIIKNNFIIYALLIYLISSINSPPFFYMQSLFKGEEISILMLINITRGLAPFFILIFCFTFILLNNKNLRFDIIYFLLFAYILCQVPFIHTQNLDKFYSYYWIFSSLSVVIFFYIIEYNKKEILHNCLVIFYSIISIIGFIFIFKVLVIFFSKDVFFNLSYTNFYGNETTDAKTIFLNSFSPRSSGLSRYLTYMFLLIYVLYVYSHSIKLKKLNIFLITLLIFLNFMIFHLQSRSSIYFIFCLSIFSFFSINKNFISKKIINFILIFLLPFLLHLSEPLIRVNIIKYIENDNVSKKNLNKINTEDLTALKIFQNNRLLKNPGNTGRYKIWGEAWTLIKKNKMIGYGPQADRVLLNHQSVSNVFFYSLLCGGVIALIFILILLLIIIVKIYQSIFHYSVFESTRDLTTKFSIFVVGFLFIRGFAETSYGLFGADYIMFILAVSNIKVYIKNFQKI